jgi:hypothetical protein
LVCCCFSRCLRYIISLFIAINFPFSMAIAGSHRLWYVVFSFSLHSRNFLISSLISSVIHCFLAVCCSFSMYLNIFCSFFSYWGLVLFCCDLIWFRGLFQFSWIY